MTTNPNNIYVTFDKIKDRTAKEIYLKQRGKVIWFTGISAPFENPEKPFIEVKNTNPDIDETVRKMLMKILPEIRFDPTQNL